jgi:hemin uptake protein HemP
MPDPTPPDPRPDPWADPPPREVVSADLLAGAREVLIRHGEHLYRLRLTAANKLILVK